MISETLKGTSRILLMASLACAPAMLSFAAPQSTPGSAAPAQAAQESFKTPQDAAQALIKAAGEYDVPALLGIFGPEGKGLFSSADPVQDKNKAVAFAEKARQKESVLVDAKKTSRATVIVGDDEWPFPVPLVKTSGSGKWVFDTKAGRQEILNRRIGANELDAIQICRGFVEAQDEYASEPHDGINQYAQKIISTPGKQDGLYWQNADGSPGGPISEAVARAIAEGYSTDRRTAYHGYHFEILKGQGPAAPLGRINYVIEGVMIGGFALVAFPAEYRVTGVKTFMVSNYGVVYEKDLGPDTLKLAQSIKLYNPDKTWRRTNDEWPQAASNTASNVAAR